MGHTFSLANYNIYLGPLADTFPAWLRERNYSSVFVIADENTREHCLPYLEEILGVAFSVEVPPPSSPVKGGSEIERKDGFSDSSISSSEKDQQPPTAEWASSPPFTGGGATSMGGSGIEREDDFSVPLVASFKTNEQSPTAEPSPPFTGGLGGLPLRGG